MWNRYSLVQVDMWNKLSSIVPAAARALGSSAVYDPSFEALRTEQEWVLVTVRIADISVFLYFPISFLQPYVAQASDLVRNYPLPEALFASLCEVFLEDKLKLYEKSLSKTLSLEEVKFSVKLPDSVMPFSLNIAGNQKVVCWVSVAQPALLLGLNLANHFIRDSFTHSFVFYMSSLELDLDVIRNFGVGDVFFPPLRRASFGEFSGLAVWMELSPVLRLLFLYSGGTCVCVNVERGNKMTAADSRASKDGKPLLARKDIASIPVNVDFSLGNKEFTLAELAAINQGYIFDLGLKATEAVTLMMNGCVFGKGELVELEGRIGVRVVSVNK